MHRLFPETRRVHWHKSKMRHEIHAQNWFRQKSARVHYGKENLIKFTLRGETEQVTQNDTCEKRSLFKRSAEIFMFDVAYFGLGESIDNATIRG